MQWKLVSVLLMTMSATSAMAADIYKCRTADGRTIFSSSGCGTETGAAERLELKMNAVGSFADSGANQNQRAAKPGANRPGSATDDIPGETLSQKAMRLQMEGLGR